MHERSQNAWFITACATLADISCSRAVASRSTVKVFTLDAVPYKLPFADEELSVLTRMHAGKEKYAFAVCCVADKTEQTRVLANGDCIGIAFVTMEKMQDHILAHIHTFEVSPNYRRFGLGQRLFDKLREHAFESAQKLRTDMTRLSPFMPNDITWTVALPGSTLSRLQLCLLLSLNGFQFILDGHSGLTIDTTLLRRACKQDVAVDTDRLHVLPFTESLLVPFSLSRADRFGCKNVDESLLQPPSQEMMSSFEKNFAVNCKLQIGKLTEQVVLVTEFEVKLPLKAEYGLVPFVLPTEPCRIIREYLNHAKSYAKKRSSTGSLYPVLVVGGEKLSGYNSYPVVNGEHDPDRQLHCTIQASSRREVNACLEHIPGLSMLLKMIRKVLNCGNSRAEQLKLAQLHFLRVDKTGQASFAWHTDEHDLRLGQHAMESLITVVVQLSAEVTTAVQMYSFKPYLYAGSGAAVAFHGGAMHRTIPWAKGHLSSLHIWKVAFFFLPDMQAAV